MGDLRRRSSRFGYAVCLIAVVVFLAGSAGFVGSAFRIVHPIPLHQIVMRHFVGPFGHLHMGRGEHGGPMPGAMPNASAPATRALVGMPALRRRQMRARFEADARYGALAHLTTWLVLLIVAGVLFARHWRWLNPQRSS